MSREATAYVPLRKGGHIPEPGGTYRLHGRRYRLMGIRLVGQRLTSTDLIPHYPDMDLKEGDHVAFVRLEPLDADAQGRDSRDPSNAGPPA